MSERLIGQSQFATVKAEVCGVCGGRYTYHGYLDHLFQNKDCMRKYWEEEEKNHISRLRQRTSRKNSKIPGSIDR